MADFKLVWFDSLYPQSSGMQWDVDKLWDFLTQKSKVSEAFPGCWCVYQLSYHSGTLLVS